MKYSFALDRNHLFAMQSEQQNKLYCIYNQGPVLLVRLSDHINYRAQSEHTDFLFPTNMKNRAIVVLTVSLKILI